MCRATGNFKSYGFAGIIIILISELLLFLEVELVAIYFTPIAWTGYILFIDALIYRLRGESFISNRRREFALMIPLSISCWLIFELYNLHLRNWYYEGLPDSMGMRVIGYAWAFATIFPGILETSELIDTLGIFKNVSVGGGRIRRGILYTSVIVGFLFLAVPPLLPAEIAKYLFGLVWMGFVFLLDPVNYYLGGKSLFRDLEKGRIDKLLSLFLAGAICGFLWEFWNYWAATKWVYDVPFLREPKIFEMPLIGFLGFLPFAVECYLMFYFAMALVLSPLASLRS